jgi:hypothetical protein
MDVPREEKASISNQMGSKKFREEKNLHKWQLASKHEDNSHLQQNMEGVPDVVHIELLEALSPISTLQQKGSSTGSVSQPLFQTPGFSSTHQWTEALQCV